jgi:hypothetical protein
MPGIRSIPFDEPIARRTRAAFDAAIAEGLPVTEATRHALREVSEALLDDHERPLVYMTLASLQLAAGRLEEWLKVIVLASILTGEARHGASPGNATGREAAIAQLREQLMPG